MLICFKALWSFGGHGEVQERHTPAEAVDVVHIIAEDSCCKTILRLVSSLQHLHATAWP